VVTAPPEEHSSETNASAASDPTPPSVHADHLIAAHAKKPKSGKPLVAIVIALLVALALAGAAVYAFTQTKDKTHQDGDHTKTSTPSTTQDTTVASDTDDLQVEADKLATDADDTKDMPESDLTDQTLGL
jgi:uncharacterized protein HemX